MKHLINHKKMRAQDSKSQWPATTFQKFIFIWGSLAVEVTVVPESLFFIKLQASDLQLYQKRGSGTGVFL